MAYNRQATGSDYNGYGTPAPLAVDGNRDPTYSHHSCAYARAAVWQDLYWQVDLGSPHVIYNLTVYGTDGTAHDGKNPLFQVELCQTKNVEPTVLDRNVYGWKNINCYIIEMPF